MKSSQRLRVGRLGIAAIVLLAGCVSTPNPATRKQPPLETRKRPPLVAPQIIDKPVLSIGLDRQTAIPLTTTNSLYITYNAGTNGTTSNYAIVFALSSTMPDGKETIEAIVPAENGVVISGQSGSITIDSAELSRVVFFASFGGVVATGNPGEVEGLGTLKLALYEYDYSFTPKDIGRQVSNCLDVPLKVGKK